MKVRHLLLPLLLIAAVSCKKDEITIIDTPSNDPTTEDSTETILDSITFDRTVSIAYSGSTASVSGTGDEVSATVDGAHVTVTNSGKENVKYILSGSTSNGGLKLYGKKKQAIYLSNVAITNTTGAAINVQNGTSYLVVEGTNTLADGSTYSATPSTEDEKAALFSEDQLIILGTGSLTVTATGKSGIASDDYLHFLGSPTLTVSSSAGHGVKANDYILVSSGTLKISVSGNMKKGMKTDGYITFDGGETTITVSGSAAYDSEDKEYTGTAGVKCNGKFTMNDGTLTITNSGTGGKGISSDAEGLFAGGTVDVSVTGSNYGNSGGWGGSSSNSVSAKGIKCEGAIAISGGNISSTAKAHEAIESKSTLNISGGIVYAYSQGDDAINSTSDMTISGGYVYAHTDGSSTGSDGLDANGNMYIKGGVVYAICSQTNGPDVALDANTEGGKTLYIQGGTLIAVGGLERGASLTQSCYQAASFSANTTYVLNVGSTPYVFKTPARGKSLIVSGSSTPTLTSGATVSGGTSYFGGMLTLGATVSGGSSVSLSQYNSGSGGGPGGGGGGGPHH